VTDYGKAHEHTVISLQNMVETAELSHLTLPERNALIDEIARTLPAGNVPSLVTSGLLRSPGKVISDTENRRNLTLLMQGMQTFLDKAVFQTFFVGPSAVLSAYQMMLKLAGKDPEQSFPEGTWQFYVEFGLREDSGRHACETIGFQNTLISEKLTLDNAEELACWLASGAWLLSQYDKLLENEWTERVQLHHYTIVTGDSKVSAEWIKQRPYSVPYNSVPYRSTPSAGLVIADDYAAYRKARFADFYKTALDKLNGRMRRRVEESWNTPDARTKRALALAAYQKQLSIRAILNPTDFSDSRVPLSADSLTIGVIVDGRYTLIRALPGGLPLSINDARNAANAVLRGGRGEVPIAVLDKLLTTARRQQQPTLRRLIPAEARADFDALRTAPILINWDRADGQQPLVKIREGRRGVGDHAMTIFRTGQSSVFDLSHIFFDGPWGIAVAEILTSQATYLARQLAAAPRPTYVALPSRPLNLTATPQLTSAARAAHLPPEVSAETALIKLEPIQRLRDYLRKKNSTLLLTVNDIFIMYRTLFGQVYRPSPEIAAELATFDASPDPKMRQAIAAVRAALETAQQANPSLLIPMDATSIDPRERIYPTTFRNPILNILEQHQKTLDALQALNRANTFNRLFAWNTFEHIRSEYMALFFAFGTIMAKYKDVTMQGESVSTSTIKLLAGLPNSVRRMLDSVPSRIDVVNDVVKGQEVFSNVGRVTPASSLRRFNTAKDDNEKKTLAWGVMTDAAGVVHISLRDFRPHVAQLVKLKQHDLAYRITRDYLESYAWNLNQFIAEVLRLLVVPRDKRSTAESGDPP